jgi:outer membrane lipoprotein-sorting protein
MSVLNSRPALRWLVPAAATVAVIGGALGVGAIAAAADPSLPQRSAAQLLVDLQTARLDGLSGTVVQRADLGLPALPNVGGQGSADLTSLIAGTHTLRVWYSGPDKARVALLGALGESDVITNGKDLWTWSSKENKASHRTLPADEARGTKPTPAPTAMNMTPQQLANLALAAIDPSTKVTTNGSAKIAGRDAYELVLTPRDAGSLVGSVRLAVDATQHVPLRVQVYARSSAAPAIEVAFTQVTFARPDDQQFTFNPPPGAQVDEATSTDKPGAGTNGATSNGAKPNGATANGGSASGAKKPAVIGTGWTSVVVARLPQPAADSTAKPNDTTGTAALLKNLPTVSGAWGSGHLLTSNLVSVLLTDDGRVLAGAVAPDRLYQAAADPAAQLGS